MCGRFTLIISPEDLAAHFHIEGPIDFLTRYNIAPTQTIPAIVKEPETGFHVMTLFHWGLIPPWAEDPKIANRLINARSETVSVRPAFRSAFKHRRCLIPTTGFFEWKREQRKKQPYLIQIHDTTLFAFAGLWEKWTNQDGEVIESCTILTTPSNELISEIHNRMPVIVRPEHYDLWLDTQTPKETLESLFQPFPAEGMIVCEVSNLVNSSKCDRPECIEPMKQKLVKA